MPKRAHGSAFFTSSPCDMLVAANGFGAPQSQAQQHAPVSPISSLQIPGQWSFESSFSTSEEAVAPPPRTFFTTIREWAATVANIANIRNLPQRFAQRFLRKQQIVAVPVLREDGSYKKRLLDVGFADGFTTPSSSMRARANDARQRERVPRPTSSDIWLPSPNPTKNAPLPASGIILTSPTTFDDFNVSDDFGEDISFDIPFSDDILTSTPTKNSKRGSLVSTSWDSPPATSLNLPVIPLNRPLLKLQLPGERNLPLVFSATSVVASPPVQRDFEISPLPVGATSVVSSSSFQVDVDSSPPRAHEASVVSSSPFQTDVDAPVYENDLSFLSDAPQQKSVRWAEKALAKPFYFDEKVSDMLDTTLESINSSPTKPFWLQYEADAGVSEDDDENTSTSSANVNSTSDDDDGGFHGVPPETFEDSDVSLDESQLSIELLEDLHDDFKKKLALAPPPLPPPTPLVVPLCSEELEGLESMAKNSNYGQNKAYPVVEEKLLARDFATLLPELFSGDPRAWLNDNIVNEYLAILVGQKKQEAGFKHQRGGPAPSIHAFSSFWYSSAKTNSVARWASKVQLGGAQYLDARLVLYPICDRGHWRLLAVKPKDRIIEYFDSLSYDGGDYINKFKEYLEKELGKAWVEEEWTILKAQRSSQQENGSDCGVFTLLNALALLRGVDANQVLSCDGMIDARERIATTLIATHVTTEFK